MYMNYITTTDLRTQSSALVDALKKGVSVSLIHRSQIVGTITPIRTAPTPLRDVGGFIALLKKIRPAKHYSHQKREQLYRRELAKRHGKHIS